VATGFGRKSLLPTSYINPVNRLADAVQEGENVHCSITSRENHDETRIPTINTRVGIDSQPGYTQILTTDSEGNAVLFTEYPGN